MGLHDHVCRAGHVVEWIEYKAMRVRGIVNTRAREEGGEVKCDARIR